MTARCGRGIIVCAALELPPPLLSDLLLLQQLVSLTCPQHYKKYVASECWEISTSTTKIWTCTMLGVTRWLTS